MRSLEIAASCIALALGPLVPASEDPACEDVCTKDEVEYTNGSSCATVTITELSFTNGTAADECADPCTPCSARVRLDWDCTGCSGGCTWVWGNQSYDEDGNPYAFQNGSGTGSGYVTQVVTNGCDNEDFGIFGVSVAGITKQYHLYCPCTP
jgi:hypothetical protein